MLRTGARQRIREARWGKGWSQSKLADVSGLSLRTIATLEDDKAPSPRGQTIFAVAEALDLDPLGLIDREVAS